MSGRTAFQAEETAPQWRTNILSLETARRPKWLKENKLGAAAWHEFREERQEQIIWAIMGLLALTLSELGRGCSFWADKWPDLTQTAVLRIDCTIIISNLIQLDCSLLKKECGNGENHLIMVCIKSRKKEPEEQELVVFISKSLDTFTLGWLMMREGKISLKRRMCSAPVLPNLMWHILQLSS